MNCYSVFPYDFFQNYLCRFFFVILSWLRNYNYNKVKSYGESVVAFLTKHCELLQYLSKDGTFIEILLWKLENYAACPLSYTFWCCNKSEISAHWVLQKIVSKSNIHYVSYLFFSQRTWWILCNNVVHHNHGIPSQLHTTSWSDNSHESGLKFTDSLQMSSLMFSSVKDGCSKSKLKGFGQTGSSLMPWRGSKYGWHSASSTANSKKVKCNHRSNKSFFDEKIYSILNILI